MGMDMPALHPRCVQCGSEVSSDEIGLTRKLINRGTSDFLCFRCLSARFSLSQSEMDALIDHFRASGCTLFL